MNRIVVGFIVVALCGCDDGASKTKPVSAAKSTTEPKPKAGAVSKKPPDDGATPASGSDVKTDAKPAPPDPEPGADTSEAPGPTKVYIDNIGGLKLGMTVEEILAVHPALKTDGKVQEITPNSSVPGPNTYYSQNYEDEAAGLSCTVTSKRRGGVQRVASIGTDLGSAAKSAKGIGEGSTLRELKKSYPKAFSPIEDEYWVPIGEGEMLTALTRRGKVTEIFLGETRKVEDIEE